MWKPVNRCLAVLASAVMVAVGPATASGAAGVKPVPDQGEASVASVDGSARDVLQAQAPLSAAAERLRVAVEHREGYAGIELEADGIVLWWKGDLPGGVSRAVEKVRSGVAVRVAPALHTRAELTAAAELIDADLRANPESPVYGVEIAYDGSGLFVNVDEKAAAPEQEVEGFRAQGEAGWDVPAEIPVTIEYGTPPETTGRLNDFAPYWGAGRIQNNDNGAYCTAGFPVRRGTATYMLTAGHCGRPGGSWNNGNDTRFFGTGAAEHVGHDLLLVSASVAGRIWDGGVGVNEFTKGVAGSADAFPGEWLCTSGSTSGAVCNFVTERSFQFSYCGTDAYGNRECYGDLVLARQLNGLPGSRPGDSGGPVFSLSGDRVIAKGIISGVSGSTLIFQDFVTAQRDFGISVVTG